jgi:HEXXH motif-containing protein
LARRSLARAKSALARVWPEQARQTSWYLKKLVVVGEGGFEGTIPELLGFSFFRSAESWSGGKVGVVSPDAFEFLLHESAHQQLLLLGRAFPLWEAEYRARVVSPWSGETRKTIALPAALHAYWITLEGLRRAGGAPARLAALRRGFKPGFALARRGLRITEHGRRFLALLEARIYSQR